MDWLNMLWVKFWDLTWWQMILWVIYLLYFIRRSYEIYDSTSIMGLKEGYKDVFIGNDKSFRVYHIIRTVFDIPPMLLGLFFPILNKILSFELYKFKEKGK